MYKTIMPLVLTILFIATGFISSASSAEFIVMQGWLISEDCMKAKKLTCPLEEYKDEKLLIQLLGGQIYRFQKNGVEDWKIQKAYGQLIGVKGLKDGETIKVTNIVQVTGDKKLTKA